jgi:metal-responsive CopG/Arc/MetJ family transcriptional regulator
MRNCRDENPAIKEKLDEVRKRQGMRSRMDLFRKSIQTYLASVGENDVAAMTAT